MGIELKKLLQCLYCGAELKVGDNANSVRCASCGREMEITRFTQEEKRLAQVVEEARISSEKAEQAVRDAAARFAQTQNEHERLAREQAEADLRAIEEKFKALRSEQQSALAGKLQSRYELAENAQRMGRFDEAIGHYQELLVESAEEEAEVHWRIVLCRYGVEYVREQQSGSFLPTITHMVVDAVRDDPDYQAAVKHARTSAVRNHYQNEARRIDDILERYRDIYAQEQPYDVFISVKQGDERGRPTEDSMVAMELYYLLKGRGLHVFNSRISLQAHAGLEYEPYIMAALMTSRIMVVVGSKPEYVNAPWLRNEWRRFRWLQENGSGKRRLIAYLTGMKPSQLPAEIGALQVINGLGNDPQGRLISVADQVFGQRSPRGDVRKSSGDADLTALLKRVRMFLEEGDFDKADEYCERILDKNPEKGEAYVYKMCVQRRLRSVSDLAGCAEPIEDDFNYRRAVLYGSDEIKNKLSRYNEEICERIRREKAEKERREKAEKERLQREMSMTNARSALKNRQYASTVASCDRIIRMYPDSAEAYWLRMQARRALNGQENAPMAGDPDFENALLHADSAQKETWTRAAEALAGRLAAEEEARLAAERKKQEELLEQQRRIDAMNRLHCPKCDAGLKYGPGSSKAWCPECSWSLALHLLPEEGRRKAMAGIKAAEEQEKQRRIEAEAREKARQQAAAEEKARQMAAAAEEQAKKDAERRAAEENARREAEEKRQRNIARLNDLICPNCAGKLFVVFNGAAVACTNANCGFRQDTELLPEKAKERVALQVKEEQRKAEAASKEKTREQKIVERLNDLRCPECGKELFVALDGQVVACEGCGFRRDVALLPPAAQQKAAAMENQEPEKTRKKSAERGAHEAGKDAEIQALERLKCPHCGGAIRLQKNGEVVECSKLDWSCKLADLPAGIRGKLTGALVEKEARAAKKKRRRLLVVATLVVCILAGLLFVNSEFYLKKFGSGEDLYLAAQKILTTTSGGLRDSHREKVVEYLELSIERGYGKSALSITGPLIQLDRRAETPKYYEAYIQFSNEGGHDWLDADFYRHYGDTEYHLGNLAHAAELYAQSVAKGSSIAALDLGRMYLDGKTGSIPITGAAQDNMQQAGMYLLALAVTGEGPYYDAEEEFRARFEARYADAQAYLTNPAILYDEVMKALSTGDARHFRAAFWNLVAASHLGGSAEADYMLGLMFEDPSMQGKFDLQDDGLPMPQVDLEKAEYYLSQAQGRVSSELRDAADAALLRVVEKKSHVQDGVIQDSWEEIFSNIENGTYSQIYSVGDLKPLDLGKYGQVNMQIAAFDTDDLADGSGKAAISWISYELLAEKHRMNPKLVEYSDGSYQPGTGSIGGWEVSEMRAWLNHDVWTAIPEAIRSQIVQVHKTQSAYNETKEIVETTTADHLWIPGWDEFRFVGAAYENDEVSLDKSIVGSASNVWWWFRDGSGLDDFQHTYPNGSKDYDKTARDAGGVALGFCTGAAENAHVETVHVQDGIIQDSWEEIFANIDNGTYSQIYSIGDLKPIDLGQYGQVNMQIAAFDADNLSDGSGKAAISWLSKELLAEQRRMNPELVKLDDGTYRTGTGAIGGWADSELRVWLNEIMLPVVPTEVQARIVSVQKQQAAIDERGFDVDQSTDDRLWIPSYDEVLEDDGLYTQLFPDDESRVKYMVGSSSVSWWWLRSAGSPSNLYVVNSDGSNNASYAVYSGGLALGFCT